MTLAFVLVKVETNVTTIGENKQRHISCLKIDASMYNKPFSQTNTRQCKQRFNTSLNALVTLSLVRQRCGSTRSRFRRCHCRSGKCYRSKRWNVFAVANNCLRRLRNASDRAGSGLAVSHWHRRCGLILVWFPPLLTRSIPAKLFVRFLSEALAKEISLTVSPEKMKDLALR